MAAAMMMQLIDVGAPPEAAYAPRQAQPCPVDAPQTEEEAQMDLVDFVNRKVFGNTAFREQQRRVIEAVLQAGYPSSIAVCSTSYYHSQSKHHILRGMLPCAGPGCVCAHAHWRRWASCHLHSQTPKHCRLCLFCIRHFRFKQRLGRAC